MASIGTVIRGDTLRVSIEMRNGRAPIDISGETYTLTLKTKASDSVALVTAQTTVANGASGDTEVVVPATANYPVAGKYHLSIKRRVGAEVFTLHSETVNLVDA